MTSAEDADAESSTRVLKPISTGVRQKFINSLEVVGAPREVIEKVKKARDARDTKECRSRR